MLLHIHIVPKGPSRGKGQKEAKLKEDKTGELSLIPGLGRSPGGGNDNPIQYSCLENSMDRGACKVAAYGVAKSWTQLSTYLSQTV